MKTIATDQSPAAVGPYSQAIQSGPFIFCSGMIPLDPATGSVVGDEIEAQTHQVFSNLKGLLGSQDRSLDNVIKTTVFLDSMGDFAAMNAIYAEYFGAHKPARSTVEVAKLPLGVKVEIECIVEAG